MSTTRIDNASARASPGGSSSCGESVHQLVRQGRTERNVAVVVHALQFMQAEPHQHPFKLGEAQQMVGLFGGAVGRLLRAAVKQKEVFVLVKIKQRRRE
ncbi:hypothetical protein G6F22_018717 [Rhizopus arrhizus]|nr:hypothetical protein G6F22_018717 [Rhizopus arrhizus]KAG0919504.1 hypothetical protein G6F32_016114 [Rhizopus arrhizus]KAG1176663.1 hypothetical protein G6F35_016458 [Rhizopus arrhizus]